MKKTLRVALSVLVALTIGLAFVHCGDDDPEEETCPALCGDGLECCDACPNECDTGFICNAAGACEEEEEDTCCPDAPDGEIHISVAGKVTDLGTQAGAATWIGAIKPTSAILPGDPPILTTTASDADGLFSIDCFDITDVTVGLVLITDDTTPDGAAGDYFPTGTGVMGFAAATDAVCSTTAAAMAVPNTLVAGIEALSAGKTVPVSAAADGFVLGMVVDATGAQVEGATITLADGTVFDEVYYPAADMSNLDGVATSANGMYVIPGSAVTMMMEIIANKDGMTFGSSTLGAKENFCFFAIVQAAE